MPRPPPPAAAAPPPPPPPPPPAGVAGGGGGVRHETGGEGAATALAGVAEGRSVDPPTAAGSAVAAAPSRRWVRAGVRACVAVSSGAIGTCSLSGGTPSPSRSRPATLAARPGADVGGVACGCGGTPTRGAPAAAARAAAGRTAPARPDTAETQVESQAEVPPRCSGGGNE